MLQEQEVPLRQDLLVLLDELGRRETRLLLDHVDLDTDGWWLLQELVDVELLQDALRVEALRHTGDLLHGFRLLRARDHGAA